MKNIPLSLILFFSIINIYWQINSGSSFIGGMLYFSGKNYNFAKFYKKKLDSTQLEPISSKEFSGRDISSKLSRLPLASDLKVNCFYFKNQKKLNYLRVEIWQMQYNLEKKTIRSSKIGEGEC